MQLLTAVLSQCIYAVYTRAFTESLHQFDDDFKQYLINTVHGWVHGLCIAVLYLYLSCSAMCFVPFEMVIIIIIIRFVKRQNVKRLPWR